VPNDGQTANAFLGVLNAAWELDLWGRLRRLDEAARARYLATEEARRGLAITLVSDVAQAYFELLELDLQLDIARRTAAAFAESRRLFGERLAAGAASELETARAEAALAATEAFIPDLERQIALKENQLQVLAGRNPAALPRAATLLQQVVRPDVPAGLPAALLERRPDLRAAEQELRAANAQVGAARADFLPRIGLTALFGTASAELSSLAAGDSRALALDAAVTGPLFSANRVRGAYRQALAARDEAAWRYRQAALTAFREVADALAARAQLEAVYVRQARAVAAYRQAVQLARDRYRAGRASYFEVLEAQQQLFPAENALAVTRLNRLLAVVQLYQALGGGWPLAPAPPAGGRPR